MCTGVGASAGGAGTGAVLQSTASSGTTGTTSTAGAASQDASVVSSFGQFLQNNAFSLSNAGSSANTLALA